MQSGGISLLYAGEPCASDSGNLVYIRLSGDITYLVEKMNTGKIIRGLNIITSYWGYRNGVFGVAYESSWRSDDGISMDYIYKVDGVEVCQEEFDSRSGFLDGNYRDDQYMLSCHESDTDGVDKAFRIADETIDKLKGSNSRL